MDKQKAKHQAPKSSHGKHDDAKKQADHKPVEKESEHDMPGAAGFRSAGAEEDTYD